MKHRSLTDHEILQAEILGLDGTLNMRLRLLSEDSAWVELGPGGYTPDHQHSDKERIVILSGLGAIRHVGQLKEIKAGDFIEIENEAHQFINTSQEPLTFVCFRNQN